MTKENSIYLDLIRFFAAFGVMLSHFSYERFSSEYFNIFFYLGHFGVIVFFVMSGYVISFVLDRKERNLKNYFISRFSRLYSVVLPVLFLIPIFDFIGEYFNTVIYDDKTASSFYIIRLLSNITFSQEFWFFSIRYLSDGPLWSLGYEFWYYVLFGFFMFLDKKKKYLIIFLVSLLIGPKILLLLPVWLFGVWIYNFHKNKSLNQNLSRVVFISTPFIFFFIFQFYNEINQFTKFMLGEIYYQKFGFSQNFLSDYITAFLIGLNILTFKYTNFGFFNKFLIRGERLIKFFANSSFSIYLFHFPLFLFFAAILHHNPNSIIDIFILFFVTFLMCILLAQFTEKKKHVYKKYITFIWEKVEKRIKK